MERSYTLAIISFICSILGHPKKVKLTLASALATSNSHCFLCHLHNSFLNIADYSQWWQFDLTYVKAFLCIGLLLESLTLSKLMLPLFREEFVVFLLLQELLYVERHGVSALDSLLTVSAHRVLNISLVRTEHQTFRAVLFGKHLAVNEILSFPLLLTRSCLFRQTLLCFALLNGCET